MNKKGFTLVELLTVIIILILLFLIVGTSVTKLIKNSRDNIYDIQLNNIKSATETWTMENIDTLPDNGECIYITLGYLKEYGIIDEEVMNAKTSKKLPSDLLIKISNNNSIINYEVNATDVSSCRLSEIAYSTIVTGKQFNESIKTLVNGNQMDYTSEDTLITKVEFYSNGRLPEGYTIETLNNLENIDVSQKQDRSVIAYHIGNGVIYIYSENKIFANTDSAYFFMYLTKVTELDIYDLDTSNVTNMNQFFSFCTSLKNLDVSNFNTSKVITMYGMFQGNTEHVMNLEMIKGIENFDTSNVENMKGMFQECYYLKSIDVSTWDTSNVTDFSYMFKDCKLIENLDLISWNTTNATNMSYMFNGCSSLTTLNLSSFKTSSVENLQRMFSDTTNLSEINGIENFDTSKVENMSAIFENCSSLKKINLLNWNTKNVTNMSYMFQNDTSLTCIQVGIGWTEENMDVTDMFNNAGISSVTTSYCIAS